MHIIAAIALASAPVGLLIGLTGTGGGALLTPMLIVLFHVKAASAVSSDLIASLIIRPLAAAVHIKRGSVNFALVGWLSLGSMPMALVGASLRQQMRQNAAFDRESAIVLGLMLITGASVLCIRNFRDRSQDLPGATPGDPEQRATSRSNTYRVRPVLTVAAGMFGGLCVTVTSVGAGTLMIVFLILIYPAVDTRHFIGTDLAQAVPLTLAAAFGTLLFSHVNLSLAVSIILGGVPGVVIGALVSSGVSNRAIQPLVAIAIFAAGLKILDPSKAPLAIFVVLAIISLAGLQIQYRRSTAQSDNPANKRSISV